jgi:hypothetical protein
MNISAAKAVPTINGYAGQYRPVWAAKFRTVQVNGKPAYFKTPEQAECAAWRVLYAVEQRVMKRDGAIVYAAKSAADRLFLGGGKVIDVERKGAAA